MRRQSFFSEIVRNFDKPSLPGSCIPAHNVFGCPHRKPNRRSVANVEKAKSRNSSLGLLRATVFRHFFGFEELRWTSRHFIWENRMLVVVKEIAAISLVKRGIRKTWGLSPPSPPVIQNNQLKCVATLGLLECECVQEPNRRARRRRTKDQDEGGGRLKKGIAAWREGGAETRQQHSREPRFRTSCREEKFFL
jgi:hypothetical protein